MPRRAALRPGDCGEQLDLHRASRNFMLKFHASPRAQMQSMFKALSVSRRTTKTTSSISPNNACCCARTTCISWFCPMQAKMSRACTATTLSRPCAVCSATIPSRECVFGILELWRHSLQEQGRCPKQRSIGARTTTMSDHLGRSPSTRARRVEAVGRAKRRSRTCSLAATQHSAKMHETT